MKNADNEIVIEKDVMSMQKIVDGKYSQLKDFDGNSNIQVDEYSNGENIIGYCIRYYKLIDGLLSVKVVDYGNGGYDTNGWITLDG